MLRIHRYILTACVIAVSATIGVAVLPGQSALAAVKDCDDNAVMRCGLNDADPINDFVAKYTQNISGDLDDIWQFSDSELAYIKQNGRLGSVTKDGNVYLDGTLVGTNAESLGRQPRSNGSAVTLGPTTFYYSHTQDSFASDSIPAIVIMDGQKFLGAILTSCGNPVRATPTGKAPKFSCDQLVKRSTTNIRTFEFNTKATALYGATVAKVVYDFGDGTSAERATPGETVSHIYANPGNYTAQVTIYVEVNGALEPVTAAVCQKPLTVQLPQTTEQPTKPLTPPNSPIPATPAAVTTTKQKTEEQTKELPSTGPAEIISGTLGGGAIMVSGYYYAASRRNLVGTLFKIK